MKEITMHKGTTNTNAFGEVNNTLFIPVAVDTDKLVGKTYKEVSDMMIDYVTRNYLYVGPIDEQVCSGNYHINENATIISASVDSDGIKMVVKDVFIKDEEGHVAFKNNEYIGPDIVINPSTGLIRSELENDITYGRLERLGIFSNLMPNGFNLYLDNEEIEDSELALLEYDLDEDVYKLKNTNFSITREDLNKSEVSLIGSDPMGDFVPAIWIIPSETDD